MTGYRSGREGAGGDNQPADAGQKGEGRSAAYASARAYLASGMLLLDNEQDLEQPVRIDVQPVARMRAREASGAATSNRAEQLVAELLRRAAALDDHAAVDERNVRLHTVQGEYPQALDNALACLRLFGIDLPAHPSWQEVEVGIPQTIWRQSRWALDRDSDRSAAA